MQCCSSVKLGMIIAVVVYAYNYLRGNIINVLSQPKAEDD